MYPTKEAQANIILIQAGVKSKAEVIRERGANPKTVLGEIMNENSQGGQLEQIIIKLKKGYTSTLLEERCKNMNKVLISIFINDVYKQRA